MTIWAADLLLGHVAVATSEDHGCKLLGSKPFGPGQPIDETLPPES